MTIFHNGLALNYKIKLMAIMYWDFINLEISLQEYLTKFQMRYYSKVIVKFNKINNIKPLNILILLFLSKFLK